ncbi:hypothetical protein J3B02_001882 [Coemansia erecta]|nr:hypothetical protein J3B02_001882 [Coemansia erecta]
MTNSEHAWPKLFRRLSLSGTNRKDRPKHTGHDPLLPTRPSLHLYQPPDISPPEPNRPNTSATAGSDIDDVTFLIQEQQRLFDQVEETRRSSTFTSIIPESNSREESFGASIDTRPPTSDRIAEFRLDIPDGVRNMTQHPGSQIVGSVVITVTRSTKAQRISLHFLGYQKVYLKDPASQSPIASLVGSEIRLFDKRLVVWGDRGSADVLVPGTLTIPFSIKLPFVNYPSSLKRDSVCKVKYLIWAELDRPGTFRDHITRTHREEIYMEPFAYPTRPCDTSSFALAIPQRSEAASNMAGVAVGLEGSVWPIPVVAGDCINYRVSAQTVSQNSLASVADPTKYVVKHARAVVVERLDVRGLIKGVEYAQSFRSDIFSIALAHDNDKLGNQSSNNGGTAFISSGQLKLPLDLCPFEGKQLSRRYELRIEFDVIDPRSLLDKVIRHSSCYAHWINLDICTVSPDNFRPETLQNAFADESLNINSITPSPYFVDPSEPELEIGGWELDHSTIYRSTVSCPDCPDRNCYKCTLGHENKLIANTGGLAYLGALVGFEMPVDGSNVKSCKVQIPAFSTPLQSPVTVVVSKAESSYWSEDTVDGENAPALGDEIASVDVPAYNNLPAVDITPACQAAINGKFSIYFNARFGHFEFWSKDSGNPAILHVVTN